MIKPTIRIHNTETNEVIDREMTDLEFEEYESDMKKVKADKAVKEQQKIAKADLLVRLGITEDEAKLLLG